MAKQGRNGGRNGRGDARISRRRFLGEASAGAAVAGLAATLPARPLRAETGRPIKIGWVHPTTGPLGPLSEGDAHALSSLKGIFEKGVMVAGKRHPIVVIDRDSQSNPNRAAEVSADLILKEEVDLLIGDSTPETTNPVADQAELNEMPCLTTFAPWQPYFFGRGGKPDKPFTWTYHYFWGLEDIIAAFTDMWGSIETNKVVGALWPNDGDGVVWADKKLGFPPELEKLGYKLVDPGRFKVLSDDFTAQISQFKSNDVQIVTGVLITPDFATFWKQAKEQNFHPKIVSIGKAYNFAAAIEAIGPSGLGLTNEVFWTPAWPFKSSLTGQTSRELADKYIAENNKQWTPVIGYKHSLFEIALDVFSRTKKLGDRESVLAALKGTNMTTVVGPVNFTGGGPVPGISRTPLLGGQWKKGDKFPFEHRIVNNKRFPSIPTDGKLEPLS